MHPCEEARGRNPRKGDEIPPLFCVFQQYSRPFVFRADTLCCWSDGSVLTRFLLRNHCRVGTFIRIVFLFPCCCAAHSICPIQTRLVLTRQCTFVAWLKPLHPSRSKCGSEIHRHESIVLIRKSCQSEQSSHLYIEHTRGPQCRATARAPESIAGRGNHSHWQRSWVLCECWQINVEKITATAEQAQEALQQLQAQGTRIAALETQLRFESARARTAEQERSALIRTLGAIRIDRGSSKVDTKGTGQPFMWKGTADQDFGEWAHKMRAFMLARFGDQILTALAWAARQRKIVVKTWVASQRDRFTAWISVFGEQADEDERIDNIDDFVGTLHAYLVSFTTDAPNRIVRNSAEGNGLESLETIAR